MSQALQINGSEPAALKAPTSLGSVINELSYLVAILTILEGEYQFSMEDGRMQDSAQAAQVGKQQVIETAKQTAKELNKMDKLGKWGIAEKVLAPIFTVVAVAVTIWVAPEISAGVIAFAVSAVLTTALSESGALKDGVNGLGKEIAKLLEKEGMSSDKAEYVGKALAGVVFAVSAVVMTVLAGGAVGGIDGALSEGKEMKAAAKKAAQAVKLQAGLNGAQMILASNVLFNSAAAALVDASQKNQEIGAIVTEMVQVLTSLVILVVGGASASTQNLEEETGAAEGFVKRLKELMSRAFGMDMEKLSRMAYATEALFGIAAEIPRVGEGLVKISLAEVLKLLTLARGESDFINAYINGQLSSISRLEKAAQGTYQGESQMEQDVNQIIQNTVGQESTLLLNVV